MHPLQLPLHSTRAPSNGSSRGVLWSVGPAGNCLERGLYRLVSFVVSSYVVKRPDGGQPLNGRNDFG